MTAGPGPFERRRRQKRGRGERLRAFKYGIVSEWLCRMILRLKGYRILGARVRTGVGEIDILAERHRVLAIVEVKARPTLAEALDAVSIKQRRRLQRAALNFQRGNPRLAGHALRFDLFAVARWRIPLHIQNAWFADPWK